MIIADSTEQYLILDTSDIPSQYSGCCKEVVVLTSADLAVDDLLLSHDRLIAFERNNQIAFSYHNITIDSWDKIGRGKYVIFATWNDLITNTDWDPDIAVSKTT